MILPLGSVDDDNRHSAIRVMQLGNLLGREPAGRWPGEGFESEVTEGLGALDFEGEAQTLQNKVSIHHPPRFKGQIPWQGNFGPRVQGPSPGPRSTRGAWTGKWSRSPGVA